MGVQRPTLPWPEMRPWSYWPCSTAGRQSSALDRSNRGAWRNFPGAFGKWNLELKRFRSCVKADARHRIFADLTAVPDFEYAMIDSSIVKAHRHGQGAKG